jgi:hypothetical protein
MDHVENDTSNSSYSAVCVLVGPVTFFLSQCLVTIGDTYIDTQTLRDL